MRSTTTPRSRPSVATSSWKRPWRSCWPNLTADTLGRMKTVTTARYSFGEEVANSVTHGVGWLLSCAGWLSW